MVSNIVGLDDQDSSEPTKSLWIQFLTNLALSIWITCVAFSSAVSLMLMTGMLNQDLPAGKTQRDEWEEFNNQILNALFTLMCLYQHPKIIKHTRLLSRQRPGDVIWLRKAYCKKGEPRPHERAHIVVVVILLHLNFLAQYVLCGLFVGYDMVDRPSLFVWISMGVTVIAPATAGAYMFLSPLRREYGAKTTDEAQCSETDHAWKTTLLLRVKDALKA